MTLAARLLCAGAVVLLLAACGSGVETKEQAGTLCGLDRAAWSKALDEATQTPDPSASDLDLSSPGDDAHELARKMTESDCLVGHGRDEVRRALGGDGTSYLLGLSGFGVDVDMLDITYDAHDRVTRAATVQG
jgi:hypothetical protein